MLAAHWAETDYDLSARQHAVLPEDNGTFLCFVIIFICALDLLCEAGIVLAACVCPCVSVRARMFVYLSVCPYAFNMEFNPTSIKNCSYLYSF